MAQQQRICLPVQKAQVRSLSQEDPLEKEMATHSSILGNSMDRGPRQATVHEVTKSQTWLREHECGLTERKGNLSPDFEAQLSVT